MIRKTPLVLAVLCAAVAPVRAQETRAASRAAADFTVEEVLTQGAKFRAAGPSQWLWHPDGRPCFVRASAAGEILAAVADDGTETPILTSAALAAAIGKAGFAADPGRLPALAFGDDGTTVRCAARTKDGARTVELLVAFEAGRVAALNSRPADAEAAAVAASGRVAWVAGRDVYVGAPGGEERRVTTGGSPDLKHGLSAHREEFGIRDGLWWDPTGRRVAFFREDLAPIAPYPFADYRAVPATAPHARYPMAGRRHSVVTIGVHDAATGRTVWLDTRPDLDRWLTNATFSPDGGTLYVATVEREQNRTDLRAYDAATGSEREVLFGESDPEWTEPEHGPLFVPGRPDRFLWHSPRDGFRHLYLYDAGGNLVRQATRGPRDVAEVVGFSPEGDRVFYLASDDDPKTLHLWSAPLDDGEPRRLTSGRGRRRAKLSPDGGRALLLYEDATTPPVLDVVDLASGATRRLFAAPDPFAGRRMPAERFFTVASPHDGALLHGHLMTPPDMVPGRRYPLLWYVYGGPHSQLVVDGWGSGADNWLRAMAARGFVVARVDGHGTDNRGLEWQQAIHRRLGTVEIADQLAALAYVKGLPFVDAARAGVFGWSYGGFMAASLMCRAPTAFKAGVAGAPVTDWALYETGYGERYMDAPAENPDGYRAADVGTYAKDLQGRLLIVHGTSDDTVVPQHSMRLIDRFVAAGKDVEFFPYPGHLHAVVGPARAHLYRKLTKFFDGL